MKSNLIALFVFVIVFTNAGTSLAQSVTHVDTIKVTSSRNPANFKSDAPSSLDLSMPANKIKAMKQKLQNLDPLKTANRIRTTAKDKLNQATGLEDKLKLPKKKSVAFNLTLENDTRYQPPSPFASPFAVNQKFVSIFNLRGVVDVGGIPLNLNFTSDRSPYPPMAGLNHDLFKFDFDPKQFSNLFKSDVQQYYDLKRTVFNDLDFSSYTQKALIDKLKQEVKNNADKKLAANDTLSKYLANENNVNQLLLMSDQQVKDKLISVALSKTQTSGKSNDAQALLSGKLPYDAKQRAFSGLEKAGLERATAGMDTSHVAKIYVPVADVEISGFVKGKIVANAKSQKEKIGNITQQIDEAKPAEQNPSQSLLVRGEAKAKNKLTGEISASENDSLNRLVDSMAFTVNNIKTKLRKQGIDVNKLVQVQTYLKGASGKTVLSEQESNLLARKPGNSLQSLFSNVQALKFGSFADLPAGNTDKKDVFMTGTTVTFKSGYIPVTFGYGTMNDIGSPKDVGYQGSIYNSAKNITYLGTTLNGPTGKVKISIIGSVNREVANSAYTMPSASSNNVALTLTKDMKLGNLGDVSVDVSKSTTLFNNNYQIGSEAILNRQAGLTNSGTDLLEALSVGFTHHLDVKELNASDNVYFNYSGMGYQNPGNNGYVGARMKFGGNLKKSFMDNKLNVTVRTDITNMPISYTSDDKWKSANIQLDGRYVFSRKFNLSLKYANLSTNKRIDGLTTPVYAFQKAQVDGNTNYKIAGHYTVAHFSLGTQFLTSNSIAQSVTQPIGQSQSTGKLLMFNYLQSMILDENSLTATVFYNKELSSIQAIGNMFTTDVTYQYKFLSKLNMSSAVTYLSNSGIAQQAGIRQGIQLYANKHFDFDSYVDLRKNLISPRYPDLYSACRAELSLKYHISN